MSSTDRPLRSKGKFEKGEKVLCFEPDPKKTKVLYEARIMDIEISKDESGKRRNAYLIHFHGWSKTQDRYMIQGNYKMEKYTFSLYLVKYLFFE